MTNPLLQLSTLEYELPDFSKLTDEHYLTAFEAATKAHLAEIEEIVSQPEITFENTLVALESSGQLLTAMMYVFYNKTASDTNEEVQRLEAIIFPKFSAHQDSIQLDPRLFTRLTELEAQRSRGELSLDAESDWLLTKYLEDFRHAGSELGDKERARVAEINERLAGLEAEFDKRLLADSNDLAINLPDSSRLSGLSQTEIDSCKQAAQTRGQDGFTIPLLNYSGHPMLATLDDRELRREILERTLSRGSRGNANDTSDLVREALDLRREKAKLFGFENYSQYVTSKQTAKSPERIHEVLRRIAPIARRNAEAEAGELQKLVERELPGEELKAWDWDRYTEQLRAERYSVDTSLLKPFFELRRVLEDGVFFAAGKLYGLRFEPRKDLTGYHPDNWVYEVFYEDGSKCVASERAAASGPMRAGA